MLMCGDAHAACMHACTQPAPHQLLSSLCLSHARLVHAGAPPGCRGAPGNPPGFCSASAVHCNRGGVLLLLQVRQGSAPACRRCFTEWVGCSAGVHATAAASHRHLHHQPQTFSVGALDTPCEFSYMSALFAALWTTLFLPNPSPCLPPRPPPTHISVLQHVAHRPRHPAAGGARRPRSIRPLHLSSLAGQPHRRHIRLCR